MKKRFLASVLFSILSLTSLNVFPAGQTSFFRFPRDSSSTAPLPSRCGKNYVEVTPTQQDRALINQSYTFGPQMAEVWFCGVRDNVYNHKPHTSAPCPEGAFFVTASALAYGCYFYSSVTEACNVAGYDIFDKASGYFSCAKTNSNLNPSDLWADRDACNPPATWLAVFSQPYLEGGGLQICGKRIELEY